ncbi:MAG: sugar transferase [Phycisphaerae bacterium]|nr:sugar transferase [Phycisphaerae bacterium]
MAFGLFIINVSIVYGAFLLSYLIRYGREIPPESYAPFQDSRLFLLGIMIASLTYAGVFRRRFRSYWLLFQKIAFGLVLGTACGFIFMYLLRDKWARFPSSVFLFNFALSIIALFAVNSVILRLKGKIQKRVVVLGNSPFYDPFQKKESLVHKEYIATIEELMNCHDMDEVMICQRIHDNPNLNLLVFLLLKLNVVVTFSPAIYAELISGKIEKSEFLALFSTFVGRKSDVEEFMIRVLDVMVSLGILILLAPVLVLIAIVIKCTSPGPVIYQQQRVGKDRKLFTLYKFRTMYENNEHADGYKPAASDDDRITPVGCFLRTTRLDELPQLINVLGGQMSLVGPRPENVTRVNMHKALRGLRLAVKPGLTGLAQVRSYYDLNPGHKIKYDYLYIQRKSFMLNLYILYKTIFVVLGRKGQ